LAPIGDARHGGQTAHHAGPNASLTRVSADLTCEQKPTCRTTWCGRQSVRANCAGSRN
jgi:hypothetical protein